MVFYLLLLALALQRLSEMRLGERHLERVKIRLLDPVDEAEKRRMIFLHGFWFISCALEFFLRGSLLSPLPFLFGVIFLMGCQIVRFHSMKILGTSWIHLPVAYQGQMISREGLYRYMNHPNYFAVVVEIALVPILGKAYITALLFTFANAVFLWQRIKIEENQLAKIGSSR